MIRAARSAAVAMAIVAALGAGCVLPTPPGDAGRASAPSPAGPTASPLSTSEESARPGVPAMLFTGPTGLALSGPGRALERVSLQLPPGTWQETAAAGGSAAILLVSAGNQAARVVIGHVVGARVELDEAIALPASLGSAVLPGCVSGDGRAVVIAAGLVYIDAGRVAGTRDVPGTAGRCQMLDDGGVAYLTEVDHAVSIWRPRDATVVVTSTHCDDFAVGGGQLGCLEGGGAVVVGPLVVPDAPGSAVDARDAEHLPEPARQVLLSPAGDWLAVVARESAAIALYRLAGARWVAAGGSTLLPGEALLGVLDP